MLPVLRHVLVQRTDIHEESPRPAGRSDTPVVVLTIGHSTRTLDELVALLKANGVERLIDVRTAPGSRRMPHFARASLEASLPEDGIEYMHMAELGGLRKPLRDSVNNAWRNGSFRGYADYMQTEDFWRAIDSLRELAASKRTAIICAEAVPWRCHRSLIADALTVKGVEVRHITGSGEPSRHKLTPFAVAANGRITYPAADTLPL